MRLRELQIRAATSPSYGSIKPMELMIMGRRFLCVLLMLGVGGAAYAQKTQTGSNQQASPTARKGSKQEPAQPRYITGSLDLTQTNLGSDFAGHDIAAVIKAVKDSPALQKKSEFETTSASETRQKGFLDHLLLGNVTPNGNFAFVIEGSAFQMFQYDADSQVLVVTLLDLITKFLVEKDMPTLDVVFIRRILRTQDDYIGTNAFGASVRVDKTSYSEYRLAIDQSNWLFKSNRRYVREFKHQLAIESEQARALKPDAKLLVVCRLAEPWYRSNARVHAPTIQEPWEHITEEDYLQVIPEQLWIFNLSSGDVVAKWSESSLNAETNTRHDASDASKGSQPIASEQAGTPTSATLSGQKNVEPVLIRNTQPVYPSLARQARIEGVIRLSGVVGRDGRVGKVEVVSGHPLLVPAALEAVKQWLYTPALINGEPVEVKITIDVPFKL